MGVDFFPPPQSLPAPSSSSPVPLSDREQYRSPRARLRSVRVLLALTSLAAGTYVGLAFGALQIDDWSTVDGRRAAEFAVGAGAVASLCLACSYVALAVWCGRMYRNLFALGVGELRYTPGWGVGAWFVPFLNLVRPKAIVDDLWRLTDARARPAWRYDPVSGTVHVWWALLLLSGLLVPLWDRDGFDREFVDAGVVSAVCVVVSSCFSWFVTSELTNRLEAFAVHRGHFVDVPGVPTVVAPVGRDAAPVAYLVGLLAFVGLLAGGLIWKSLVMPLAGDFSPDPSAPRRTSVFDLEIGDCFDEPSSATSATAAPAEEIDAVGVVPCDVPHTFELIDVVEHGAPPGAAFPGEVPLARYGFERCAEDFEDIVGTPFRQSVLDLRLYWPTEDSWRLGDREIQCLAIRMDGRSLVATVVGSGL